MKLLQQLSISRFKRELRTPSRLAIRNSLDLFKSLSLKKRKIRGEEAENIAVWDSSSNAITFDFLWFNFMAFEYFGEKPYHLIIYDNNKRLISDHKGYSTVVSADAQRKRISDLIIPMGEMISCVRSVSLYSEFADFEALLPENVACLYPRHYSAKYSPSFFYREVYKILETSKADADSFFSINPTKGSARTAFDRLISGTGDGISVKERFVTLTFRDYGYDIDRNTSQADVDKAVEFSNLIGASLVIVPDELKNISSYKIPERAFIAYRARECINERAELYLRALVNIFTPSGPASLSMYCKGPITFVVNMGSGEIEGGDRVCRKIGLVPNSQPYRQLSTYLFWEKGRYSSEDLVDVLWKFKSGYL